MNNQNPPPWPSNGGGFFLLGFLPCKRAKIVAQRDLTPWILFFIIGIDVSTQLA